MNPLLLPAAIAGPANAPAITICSHPRRRQFRSDDLFGGQREVLIEHAGQFYSLRQTSKGKLILTK